MPILDIFSKRERKARGDDPDVYVYDSIPDKLRAQIVHIIRDAFGQPDWYSGNRVTEVYKTAHRLLCREYGKFSLGSSSQNAGENLFQFFLETSNYEEAIDVIEVCFSLIDGHIREKSYQWNAGVVQQPDEAIDELNARFQEHGVGFEYKSGRIIRIDSEFLHSDVVKPTLLLLEQNKFYAGANQEFLTAHEHYRHKRYKECMNDCLKAFESVMKAICDKRNWNYGKNATAKALIDTCFANNLVPSYMQSQFSALRSILQSGVPTTRNKTSGHGQGTTPVTVSQPLASYTLHLTAANILFLAKREQELT